MQFDLRIVYLFGESQEHPVFKASYSAALFTTAGASDSLQVPDPPENLLADLIRQARQREWDAELNRVRASVQFDAATDVDRIVQGLSVRGPTAIMDRTFGQSSEILGQDVAAFVERLKARAEQIWSRRTVFCLPGKPEIATSDSAQATFKRLANDALTMLEAQSEAQFAFILDQPTWGDDHLLNRLTEEMHLRAVSSDFSRSMLRQGGPILLVGPTGSGKSYFAKQFAARHGNGGLLEVNLAAVSETTLESRLRGYVAGTFTGAKKEGSKGWFEIADEGVLFLDEFQSVDQSFQTQLLDLLHAVSNQVAVARMGRDFQRTKHAVKVILAINEDLNELVDKGRLRRDLYYRMRRIVHFPSLKDRLTSNPALLHRLLETYRWKSASSLNGSNGLGLTATQIRCLFPKFSNQAIADLSAHEWPGNFRELERVAFDIYEHIDERESPEVDDRVVAAALSAFSLARESRAESGASAPTDIAASKLHFVEKTLREKHCVIQRALPDLKVLKMGSRPSLRRYLIKNRDHISEDLLRDSRIQKFIEER